MYSYLVLGRYSSKTIRSRGILVVSVSMLLGWRRVLRYTTATSSSLYSRLGRDYFNYHSVCLSILASREMGSLRVVSNTAMDLNSVAVPHYTGAMGPGDSSWLVVVVVAARATSFACGGRRFEDEDCCCCLLGCREVEPPRWRMLRRRTGSQHTVHTGVLFR